MGGTSNYIKNPGIEGLCVLLRVIEPFIVIAASVLAYALRHHTIFMPTHYLGLTLLGALAYASFAGSAQLYTANTLRSDLLGLPRMAGVLLASLVVVVVVLFLFKISDEYSRAWLVGWGGAVAVGLLLLRDLASYIIRRRTRQGQWLRRVAVLGATPKALEFISQMRDRHAEMKLHGIYADDTRGIGPDMKRSLYKGDMARLLDDGLHERYDDLIIGLVVDDMNNPGEVFDQLHQLPVNVYYCLPTAVFNRVATSGDMAGLPLVLLYRRPIEGYRLHLKRAVDIAVAGTVLLMLSPLMLAVAAAVKLTSPGPVFFRQMRGGFGGDEFAMLKFRSMRAGAAKATDASGKEKQASKNDPRVTPVGRFIRRTSIDELPQLINVLKGDMSLVGPRPHAISHNSYYGTTIDRYASRHKMRPGLTGWAQINGWRGETDTHDKMAKRVEFDVWYIENWSMRLDLKIILLTPLVVLFQRQAY